MARSLYSNRIGDAGAKAIGDAMKINNALEELSCVNKTASWPLTCTPSDSGRFAFRLDNDGIGLEGAKAISEALMANAALKTFQYVTCAFDALVATSPRQRDITGAHSGALGCRSLPLIAIWAGESPRECAI